MNFEYINSARWYIYAIFVRIEAITSAALVYNGDGNGGQKCFFFFFLENQQPRLF